MDISQLTSAEREILVRSVESQINQIDTDLQVLTVKRSELEALVSKLRSGGNGQSEDADSKNDSWLKKSNRSLKQLCIEALEKLDDFKSTSDVYEYVRECYPESKNADRDKIVASLSWSLTQLSEAGLAVKINRQFSKGFYWGLPKWFDGGGIVLADYERKLRLKGVPDFVYERESQIKNKKVEKLSA